MPDDKQPEATSVAEVILEQLLLTWKAEFERFRATKMFPEQLDGASEVAKFHAVAQQFAVVHARLDTLAQMLGHDVSPKATVTWLKQEAFPKLTRLKEDEVKTVLDIETAHVEWVVSLKHWRYRIENGDRLRTGWLDDSSKQPNATRCPSPNGKVSAAASRTGTPRSPTTTSRERWSTRPQRDGDDDERRSFRSSRPRAPCSDGT